MRACGHACLYTHHCIHHTPPAAPLFWPLSGPAKSKLPGCGVFPIQCGIDTNFMELVSGLREICLRDHGYDYEVRSPPFPPWSGEGFRAHRHGLLNSTKEFKQTPDEPNGHKQGPLSGQFALGFLPSHSSNRCPLTYLACTQALVLYLTASILNGHVFHVAATAANAWDNPLDSSAEEPGAFTGLPSSIMSKIRSTSSARKLRMDASQAAPILQPAVAPDQPTLVSTPQFPI